MMVLLSGLVTFTHGGKQNQQERRVPLMWPVALCSDLNVVGWNFEEIHQH